MDFSYTFKQAHQDRLEDAGVKKYRRQNTEGYVVEATANPERKTVIQRAKRVALAVSQLLVK